MRTITYPVKMTLFSLVSIPIPDDVEETEEAQEEYAMSYKAFDLAQAEATKVWIEFKDVVEESDLYHILNIDRNRSEYELNQEAYQIGKL